MNSVTILPNELFDDGSMECLTFCVVGTNTDGEQCVVFSEFDAFKASFGEYINAIQDARSRGEHYIPIKSNTHVDARYSVDGTTWLEIQWD